MSAKASLSITDQRRSARHRLDAAIPGEHRTLGEISLSVANVSADGIMVAEIEGIARGDRVMIRLPVVGHLEAVCTWATAGRAGLQFERPIRPSEFPIMLAVLQGEERSDVSHLQRPVTVKLVEV
jgi:hypothetical protein